MESKLKPCACFQQTQTAYFTGGGGGGQREKGRVLAARRQNTSGSVSCLEVGPALTVRASSTRGNGLAGREKPSASTLRGLRQHSQSWNGLRCARLPFAVLSMWTGAVGLAQITETQERSSPPGAGGKGNIVLTRCRVTSATRGPCFQIKPHWLIEEEKSEEVWKEGGGGLGGCWCRHPWIPLKISWHKKLLKGAWWDTANFLLRILN